MIRTLLEVGPESVSLPAECHTSNRVGQTLLAYQSEKFLLLFFWNEEGGGGLSAQKVFALWHGPTQASLVEAGFLGIRSKTKRWIEDFLSSRTQQKVVKGEHNLSYSGLVTSDVPQGSILGPSLFLIPMNLVMESSPECAFSLATPLSTQSSGPLLTGKGGGLCPLI